MSDGSNTLRVSLFAGMAEIAGARIVGIPWAGGTVSDVRRAILASHPGLESLLARSAIAIGDRYASADEPVPHGADVAIIPPVSGG